MKHIIIVLLLLFTVNAQASQRDEVLNAVHDIKRSCGKAHSHIKDSIKESEKFQSQIDDLLNKLSEYSGYSSAKSSLRRAKENLSDYLRGAKRYRNEMYWCDDFDVYTLYNLKDAIREYNHMVKKVQNAENDFSPYVKYYNKAAELYNEAIKELKNN